MYHSKKQSLATTEESQLTRFRTRISLGILPSGVSVLGYGTISATLLPIWQAAEGQVSLRTGCVATLSWSNSRSERYRAWMDR